MSLATIHPMKPYKDAREQDVVENSYALPQPGISDPIDIAADPAAPEDVCIGCSLPTRLHRDLTGKRWLGCKGALAAQTPRRNPERWNDPYVAVTCEARRALFEDCGADMEIHCACYTHQELLDIASAIAKAVIRAYRLEQQTR